MVVKLPEAKRGFVLLPRGWVVRMDGDLYVRSVNGRDSDWFRGVKTRHEGHIRAGGVDKDVLFEEVPDPDLNNRIDDAYRIK